MRRWIFLAVLVPLAGCYELDHIGATVTHAAWDRSTDDATVDMTIESVEADLLGCADVPTCVDRVGEALAVPATQAEAKDTNGHPDFTPGRSLVAAGAKDVRVALVRRGPHLDMQLHYVTPMGSTGADFAGVGVEREGRVGHEKARLFVTGAPGRTIDVANVKHRTTDDVDDDGKRQDTEVLLLPRHASEVTVTTVVDGVDAPSAIETVPGLEDALVEKGWLAKR